MRYNYYAADQPNFQTMCEAADEKLFERIISDPHHVLAKFLLRKTTHSHNLRSRAHKFSLFQTKSSLEASNFLPRMLFKNSY